LIHAPTDRHLWAESYERDVRDALALQSDVAKAIARDNATGRVSLKNSRPIFANAISRATP
jgi:TolB-like protein